MHAFRPLYLLLAALSFLAAPQPGAEAEIAHRVHFKADAKIIVWGESKQHEIATQSLRTAPKLHQTAHRLHTPLVQTGHLIPAHSILPLERHATRQAQFNVASNTGFAIKAELAHHTLSPSQLQKASFHFELNEVGAKASAPLTGETGFATSLADLIAPVIVYQSPVPTAAKPGSIAEQSLAFDARWDTPIKGGFVDIIFTVFKP
ncbi:MAG: hypothetical protein ACRBEQ_13310 [Hyphomonas sp.]